MQHATAIYHLGYFSGLISTPLWHFVDCITVKEPRIYFVMMGKENRHGDIPFSIYVKKFSFVHYYQNLLGSSWKNWGRVHTQGHIKSLPRPVVILPDTQNWRLCMRRERFSRHRFQRKPLVDDLGIHHGTSVTRVPWCMSGSLTRGGGKHVPGIHGACAARNFALLVRGPCRARSRRSLPAH